MGTACDMDWGQKRAELLFSISPVVDLGFYVE